jgi:hypothetical protein
MARILKASPCSNSLLKAWLILIGTTALLTLPACDRVSNELSPYIGDRTGPGADSCQPCGKELYLYNPLSVRVDVVVLETRRHPSDTTWNYSKTSNYQIAANGKRLMGCSMRAPAPSGACILTYTWAVRSWKQARK